jgi:RNA polymerase sigma-70 factor (ECF subfamily)
LSSSDMPSLLGRIESGDLQAESELLQHFAPRVRAIALARTRDPDLAKDLTQEALVAVLQAARKGQIRDHSRVGPFVCSVARNVINNYRRRSLKHAESPLDEEMPSLAIEDDHDGAERRRLLAGALATLSPSDRQVLRMTLVEGLKPGEIAERIGASAEVVRTRKLRAVKRLLEVLETRSRNALVRHLL